MKKDNNIDTEFTDIDKENKYKDYIIVGILYIVVIILFVFFILGIKNQKEIVKNNIVEENITSTVEEDLDTNEKNIDKEETKEIDSNESNLFDKVTDVTKETSKQIEENNNSYINMFDQLN